MKQANTSHGSIKSYIIGFASSLALTLAAYWLVTSSNLEGWGLGSAIVALALVQLLVQLVCFLHLGREEEPRWNLLVFDFTLVVVVILVIGTMWIMNNLHYNMTPQQAEQELLQDELIRPARPESR